MAKKANLYDDALEGLGSASETKGAKQAKDKNVCIKMTANRHAWFVAQAEKRGIALSSAINMGLNEVLGVPPADIDYE